MSWGQSDKFFETLKAMGKKVGKSASDRPPIPQRLAPYWKAFIDLHKRRQWHQSGPQPFTYGEITTFIGLKFSHMGKQQVQRLVCFMEAMDDAYLQDYSEKQERSRPA